jgi:hypothetical protein
MPIADRPSFVLKFFPAFLELRSRTGRPHWLVVDETHHVLPSSWEPGAIAFPQRLDGIVRITVEPGTLVREALETVEMLIAAGEEPEKTVQSFWEQSGVQGPKLEPTRLDKREMVFWSRRRPAKLLRLQVVPGRSERHRHRRKYAEGELPPDRSFYFRGAQQKLNLRVQNLMLFNQIADGIDDETWLFHLRRGEYSSWFREAIKDEKLAEIAEKVERDQDLSPRDSRIRIRELIEERYTVPASSPLPVPGTDAGPEYSS